MRVTAETIPVQFTVLALRPVAGQAPLIGMADVRITFDGVPVLVRGWRVVQQSGGLVASAPRSRGWAGEWIAVLELPPELDKAIDRAVVELAMQELRQ